ncbi:MAG: hypothetical protein FJ255_05170 [Phycisphaerae bacterium]|nr:hypothetical protein [Phycisphaerae bacterium]
MSQSNYAAEAFEPGSAPARISLLATLSIVAGAISLVLCCIPAVGPVIGLTGAGLAIGAIVAISGSAGRLGGKGLASAGLITSMLGIVLGLLVTVGLVLVMNQLKTYGAVFTAAEQGDVNAAAPLFSTNTPQPLTAEALASFRDRYTATLGAYKGVEGGFKMVAAGAAIGGLGPSLSGSTARQIPLMGVFEKGQAPIVFLADPQPGSQTTPAGPLVNVIVVPAQGEPIWLFDQGAPAPPAPAPGGGA